MPGGPWCLTDVPAEQACLGIPHGIDVAADGALIVADAGHHRIDRVGRRITTVLARLPDGRILVTDPANNRVIELR